MEPHRPTASGRFGAQAVASPLPPADRARGQRAAILANLGAGFTGFLVTGPLMMLFAHDVLRFDGMRIAGILALMPWVGLLRLFVMGPIRGFGKVRVLRAFSAVRIALVVALILAPVSWLRNFWLYAALVVLWIACFRLGQGSVWQPLLRDVTTHADRGRFFARMRFCFMTVTAMVVTLLPLLIGESITAWQYKLLLGVALVGMGNQYFWYGRIPEVELESGADGDAGRGGRPKALDWRRLGRVLRESKLLRWPLLFQGVALFFAMPIYVVYLKSMLHVPTNVVSWMVAAGFIGGAGSMLLWGRVADAVGYRPMATGLLALQMAILPLQLLLAPFPEAFAWAAVGPREVVTIIVLLVHGLVMGALGAGFGIAQTSIQHHHVRSDDAVEAMGLADMILLPVQSAAALWFGYLLDGIARPSPAWTGLGGWLHLDYVKGYLLCVALPLMGMGILILRRLPNTRPWFGVGDFFQSLGGGPVRSLWVERGIWRQDEAARLKAARWLAAHPSPLAVEPLSELLSDPSYDVKVAAIRGLAETGSALAGKRLLELLRDEERRFVADHLCWSLGELAYQPAFDDLVARLDERYAGRIRAMAARALGKLGDPRAIPPLAAVLRDPPPQQHVISSTCRALLSLNARRQVDGILAALVGLTERDERYEIIDGLCTLYDISNEWLLRYLEGSRLKDALQSYASFQSDRWRAERANRLRLFAEQDLEGTRRAMDEAVAALADAPCAGSSTAAMVSPSSTAPSSVAPCSAAPAEGVLEGDALSRAEAKQDAPKTEADGDAPPPNGDAPPTLAAPFAPGDAPDPVDPAVRALATALHRSRSWFPIGLVAGAWLLLRTQASPPTPHGGEATGT